MNEKPNCTAPGCDEPQHAKGYCRTHYSRMARHGGLELLKKRPHRSSVEKQEERLISAKSQLEREQRLYACSHGPDRIQRGILIRDLESEIVLLEFEFEEASKGKRAS